VLLGQLARQSGLIGEETFVAIIIVALITSLIAGPAMQRLLRVAQPRRLSGMISDRTLVHGLHATDAREAIRELADRAAPLIGIDPLIIDQAVWDREQTMRTGLPGGLAVPHARLAEIKKPLVVLARSQTGIDFDAPDGRPAHLLFLLLTPLNDQTVQLELLSAIGRAFQHEWARQAVLTAQNTTEVVAAVNMAENALGH
jgi:mannitol/fructose-specific phosphotransferase system IIA component (Ntr-type)